MSRNLVLIGIWTPSSGWVLLQKPDSAVCFLGAEEAVAAGVDVAAVVRLPNGRVVGRLRVRISSLPVQ